MRSGRFSEHSGLIMCDENEIETQEWLVKTALRCVYSWFVVGGMNNCTTHTHRMKFTVQYTVYVPLPHTHAHTPL